MKRSELKQLIREVIEEVGAHSFSVEKNKAINELTRLDILIKRTYPHVATTLETNQENVVLEIDTEETTFTIRVAGYRGNTPLYSVDAVWPDDEKGKQRLSVRDMLKAIGSVPGVKDPYN